MFKSVFLTEFSLSNKQDNIEDILKLQLLTNKQVIIPARTVIDTDIYRIIDKNFSNLKNKEIIIAHGKDIKKLTDYLNKIDKEKSNFNVIKEIFKEYEYSNLTAQYKVEETLVNFNRLMNKLAREKVGKYGYLFNNIELSDAILNYYNNNNAYYKLHNYFDLIDKYEKNKNNANKLKAHAKYYYNYFGANSTGSGNTFSVENTLLYNYIEDSYSYDSDITDDKPIIAINLLIQEILNFKKQLTIKDLKEIDINEAKLKKLNFKDILEIRENWLHEQIINKYEEVVDKVTEAYFLSANNEIEKAIKILEEADEIKKTIKLNIKSKIKTEILLHKMFETLMFFSNTLITNKIIELPDTAFNIYKNIMEVKSIISTFMKGTTELTSFVNNNNQLKKIYNSKKRKLENSIDIISATLKVKSPLIVYLKQISNKLKEEG